MRALIAVVAAIAAFASLGHANPGGERTALTASPVTAMATDVTGPTVVAVGDIACEPGGRVTRTKCQQESTAALATGYDPRYVLGLGDLQYEKGSHRDFLHSYHEAWGALRPITKPVPGNHEYRTDGARGYYRYFAEQETGASGYYAFDIDDWRIYALNSNCAEINCARELRWMNRNMAKNPRLCTAIMMHHPRYSSGSEHGNTPETRPFWRVAYRHHADVALAGHDHDYERFRRMDSRGHAALDGLFSFVSGAGGKTLYPFGRVVDGSLTRDNHAPGVLALTLGKTEFAFEYQTIDGRVIDSGVRNCR